MNRPVASQPSVILRLLTGGLLLLAILPQAGADPARSVSGPHIEVSLISEVKTVQPGAPFQVAVRLVTEPGWHTYWRNSGDSGLPTRVRWDLPEGGKAGPLQWPYPERIDYQGLINYGYHGDTLLLVDITPPGDLKPGQTYPLRADVNWLVCKDVCIPGSGSIGMNLDVTTEPPQPGSRAARFAETRDRLPRDADIESAGYYLNEHLTLEIRGAGRWRDTADRIQFFPVTPDLVVNAVEPEIQFRDNRLLVRTAANPDFPGPAPDRLDGLLVVGNGGDSRAYRFRAAADPSPIAFPEDAGGTGGSNLLFILLLAFGGGVLLNLMPCVFPVLSIKILSLIKSGTRDPVRRQWHGIAYTLGILISMLAFGGVLLAFRSAGEAVGWGFQLQSPLFVAVLVYILFLMALALSGYVHMGTSLTRAGNLLDGKKGLTGSLFNGILATIVATPCTVPFMATAVGFALTQSIPAALAVFAVLGLGLAAPFLLLAFIPALAGCLPRPGQWMENLKQLLAFPLYFTVIWLLWVLARLSGSDTPALVLAGMVLIGLALWLWQAGAHSAHPLRFRLPALLSGLLALACLPGILVDTGVRERPAAVADNAGLAAVPYTETALREALTQGRPVFVNINADWCITCKVNERVALKDKDVHRAFDDHDVLYMEGDWTDGNATLTRLLNRFERSGVPLYLLYRPGESEPRILPQLLTPAAVIKALEG